MTIFGNGQRVICIRSNWSVSMLTCGQPVRLPRKGTIYTVKEFVDGDEPAITLEEVQVRSQSGEEVAFEASAFRPVDEIDQFRELVAAVWQRRNEQVEVIA